VKATDAEDAGRQLAAWSASLGDTAPDPGLPTVADALERWFVHTTPRREARSNETVRGLLDHHLVPSLGHLPVSEVTVGILERFYARLSASGLSDGTIRHLHYSVRPALRLAVRWGWIERNPADSVELGPLRRRQIRPPSDEDVNVLLNAAATTDPALALFVRLYAVTGARRGEIAALRRSKVDSLAGAMTIDSALTSPKSGLAVKRPKTDRSQRAIGIDSLTAWAIEAQHVRNIELGMIDNPDAFIFADLRRDLTGQTPHAPGVWSQRFARLRAELGLIGIRMHDARHYFATSLLTDGTPVTAVSAALGHGRTSTTLDTYGLWASRATDPSLAERLARRLRLAGPG
jgi:integrase